MGLHNLIIGPSVHGRRYVVDEILPRGSSGQLYRVRQKKSKYVSPMIGDQPLALKWYHHSSASPQRPVLDEIIPLLSMASVAGSPHAVQFYDHSAHGQHQEYLVMEYVPTTMKTYLQQTSEENNLPALIDLYLQQMPAVLAMLWDAGIVHCDLRLPNIGIKNGLIKLLDFGLATTSGTKTHNPGMGGFFPPEIGKGIVTPALDTYCTARNLEYILTGSHAGRPQQTIDKIEFFYDLTLPPSWRRMFSSMLNPDYTKRPTPEMTRNFMADAFRDSKHLCFNPLVDLNGANLFSSSSSFFDENLHTF